MFARSQKSQLFFSLLPGLVLAAGLLIPRTSLADDPERAKEIREVEKQIQALNQKLAELKKGAGQPSSPAVPDSWLKGLNWRPIGPAVMGGRIVALSVYDADPCLYWVATASGGLLKTENNGVTFEHQFDHEATVSIGDVCVAPSDPKIVWVGTGENNPRNSVSYGDGVYKSVDGGKTWKNLGLKTTFQIGRIAVHPKNPDIVYVGALGRLYGPNPDRGLYKTSDGGKTWERILYIDDKTGIIDVQINPANPETVVVAAWERQRDGFDSYRGEPAMAEGYDAYDPIKKWGPGSGLYKTTDGGKHFTKLTKGLPTGALGRIGINYFRKNPNTLYAIVDCDKIGMGTPPSNVYLGVQGQDFEGAAKITEITPNSPAAKAGLKAGDVIKAVDKKPVNNYEELAETIPPHQPGDKMTLSILRDKQPLEITITLENRPDTPSQKPVTFAGLAGEDTPSGIRLTQIVADGPAGKAGLKAGDVIIQFENKGAANFKQLGEQIRAHKNGDKVGVKVQRGPETKDFTLTLETRTETGALISERPYSFWYGGQRENVQNLQGPDSFQYGGVYKSTDGGDSWTRINSCNPRPMYFSQIRVDPSDEKYLFICGIALYRSQDGGKTFKPDGGNGVHPDQHALWIDPRDGRHMIVGCDGGFYATYDRMNHWDHLNHTAIGQFYHVCVDSRHPYRVYGGLQDNGSWGGPNRSLSGPGPKNDEWIVVAGGDGFVCRVDPFDPDIVYFESQDGHMGRRNLKTGAFAGIRPKDPEGQPPYRFNWNTPFIVSTHNPGIFYCGANFVFRSIKRGDELKAISPEISRTKRGTATAIAESPKNPDVLYAGTDDGNLWITRDGGTKWVNVADKIGLGSGRRWVASIEPSHFEEGRAYVVFDGHRSDDDQPYVFVSEDFGQTWKSLRANLPSGSTRVLREDLVNPNLLFLGTEFAAWASLDRGQSWVKINNNLPTVAVHEFALPTTANDLVAATHGRSIWVLDIATLRQLTTETTKAQSMLFKPSDVIRWRSEPEHGSPYGHGSRLFRGQNPPPGAHIDYALRKNADHIDLKILDYMGRTVRQFTPPKEAGLHRITWDLQGQTSGPPDPAARGRRGRRGPRLAILPITVGSGLASLGPAAFVTIRPGAQGGGAGPVLPGNYQIVLTVNGEEFQQGFRVEADPVVPDAATNPADAEEFEKEMEMEMGRKNHRDREDD